jgi:hypothetical protein
LPREETLVTVARRTHRVLLASLVLAGLLVLALDPAAADSGKGRFAFWYSPVLTEEELSWLERFEIVVPGEILPLDQIARLKAAGSQLFFYSWSTGMYVDNPSALPAGSWEAKVWERRKQWLLNPNKAAEGPDGQWRSYYYDPGAKDFRRAWTNSLTATRKAAEYDGVFFDLVGSLYVPDNFVKVFKQRHPGASFDKSLAEAFRMLRTNGTKVFTNQGYRTAAAYLPASTHDLTESIMTSFVWGEPVNVFVAGEGLVRALETFYRPWDEVQWIVDDIQAQVARYNPAVTICHLNYVNARFEATGQTTTVGGQEVPVFARTVDRAAIFYGYALAKLWGHESYSPGDSVALSRDEVYFTRLGKPLGASWEQRGEVVLRYYENGIVAVGAGTDPATADVTSSLVPADVTALWDLYDEQQIDGPSITLVPTRSEASGRLYPAGRVYLYIR